MTQEQYTKRRASILHGVAGAIKSHCPRTARARLRDLAKLENEFNGVDYVVAYHKQLEEYDL